MESKFTTSDVSQSSFPLMETISQHEDRLKNIESRLENTVTKLDLERAINASQKWIIGTVVLGFFALFIALHEADSEPPLNPQPTVIVVPSGR